MQKRSRSSQMLQGIEEGLPFQPVEADPPTRDVGNMILLVVLYAMQGVPLGLSSGSIPFILKSRASYTEVGFFSLAAYPYSLKLLWSPVVDSIFSSRIGWRKSWVLPIQMASGILMILTGEIADKWLETANIRPISILFFIFVLLAATQDIAVDGWALTLLSRKNIGHASTCQTIGMTSGYFLSFTIFLALNDPSFCNNHIRFVANEKGILSLSNYFHFWGWIYIIVTILLIFKREKPHDNVSSMKSPSISRTGVAAEGLNVQIERRSDMFTMIDGRGQGSEYSEDHGGISNTYMQNRLDGSSRRKRLGHGSTDSRVDVQTRYMGVGKMYGRLWAVANLPNIRKLTTVLLISKIGSVTAEVVGVFKLMEKGVTRETVSLVVLIEFPLELLFALFAGRWASKGHPFSPWLYGYFIRLTMAIVSTVLVATFPLGATLYDAPLFYVAMVLVGVVTSFASTLMFVSQGTFFARISDSSMGGSYLTLLNTISNLGYAWPKFFVFLLIDLLTIQKCVGGSTVNGQSSLFCPTKKTPDMNNPCIRAGGTCMVTVDGFYPLSLTMAFVGFWIGLWCKKRLHELEVVKDDSWQA